VTPRLLSNSRIMEGSRDPRRCSGLKLEGAKFRLTLGFVGGEDFVRVMKVESESSDRDSLIDFDPGDVDNDGKITLPCLFPRVNKSSQDLDNSMFDGGLALRREDSEQRFSEDFDKLRLRSRGSRCGSDPDRGLCFGSVLPVLRLFNDDVVCGLMR